MARLQNKIVFITGASSGIGKASAIAFANEGADLIIAARRIDKLKELETDLKEKYKVDILTIQLDVRNKGNVKMRAKIPPDIPAKVCFFFSRSL